MSQFNSRCPEARRKQYQEVDWCSLTDKLCLLEAGLECEEWEDVQREWCCEERLADEMFGTSMEDLSDVLTFIRRMDDIFVGITTPSTMSNQRLADLTRTHIKFENIGGTTVVYCEKPHTELYALEIATGNGYPRAKLAPIL